MCLCVTERVCVCLSACHYTSKHIFGSQVPSNDFVVCLCCSTHYPPPFSLTHANIMYTHRCEHGININTNTLNQPIHTCSFLSHIHTHARTHARAHTYTHANTRPAPRHTRSNMDEHFHIYTSSPHALPPHPPLRRAPPRAAEHHPAGSVWALTDHTWTYRRQLKAHTRCNTLPFRWTEKTSKNMNKNTSIVYAEVVRDSMCVYAWIACGMPWCNEFKV